MTDTYEHTLQYAGSKPFETEQDRLPYPVAEALEQDSAYVRLAELRYIADRAHEDAPDAAEQDVFGAWNSADHAVDAYVREWLTDPPEYLDDENVAAARAEYGVEQEDAV
jgi:hypothetical protein